MRRIQEMENEWRERRPLIQNTSDDLISMLRDELVETEAELESPEKLARELADLVLLTCALATLHEIDLEAAVRSKLNRNVYKYPWEMFQTGDYNEKREICRRMWNPADDALF